MSPRHSRWDDRGGFVDAERESRESGTEERRAVAAPRRRPDLHLREIDGETIVLDRANGQMHSLNPTAAFIFLRIDGQRTAGKIAGELAEHFEVSGETASADTERCLEEFRSLGLLVS